MKTSTGRWLELWTAALVIGMMAGGLFWLRLGAQYHCAEGKPGKPDPTILTWSPPPTNWPVGKHSH